MSLGTFEVKGGYMCWQKYEYGIAGKEGKEERRGISKGFGNGVWTWVIAKKCQAPPKVHVNIWVLLSETARRPRKRGASTLAPKHSNICNLIFKQTPTVHTFLQAHTYIHTQTHEWCWLWPWSCTSGSHTWMKWVGRIYFQRTVI